MFLKNANYINVVNISRWRSHRNWDCVFGLFFNSNNLCLFFSVRYFELNGSSLAFWKLSADVIILENHLKPRTEYVQTSRKTHLCFKITGL